MAFSTELVLAAQTGPGVNYRTVSTAAKTGSGSATLATTSVTEGAWLVVFSASPYAGYPWAVTLAGGGTQTVQGSSNSLSATEPISHCITVNGPATVTVSATSGTRLSAGTLRIARVG